MLTLLFVTVCAFAQQDAALDLLQREMERVAKVSEAAVGVTAIHIES